MKKIILLLTFLFFIPIVLAQPADHWGTVTVNGEQANQVTVTAYINGELKDTHVVGELTDFYYLVHINGNPGDIITFKINGHNTDQTAEWIYGGYELNLTTTYTEGNPEPPTGGGGGGGGGGKYLSSQEPLENTTENNIIGEIPELISGSLNEEDSATASNGQEEIETKSLLQRFLDTITGAATGTASTKVTTLDIILMIILVGLITVFISIGRAKKAKTL
ncbi:MAG: hypothetical protein ABIH25_04690 [Candidatus Woesearchaeota archaeon]